jgi:hypothetical protein
VWYFYYILMTNYFDSRRPPRFYTNPERPFPLTYLHSHSNQTWRHRNRIDFILFHSRWVHRLSFAPYWSEMFRYRRQRTRSTDAVISAPDMLEFVDTSRHILPYNVTNSSRRDQYYAILIHLMPYYADCIEGHTDERELARLEYITQQRAILARYCEPELSHMRRVLRTIIRWRLLDRRLWRDTNIWNRNTRHNDTIATAPWAPPVAQVNLLRLHDRAYASVNAPHPRSIYLSANRMLQGGLYHDHTNRPYRLTPTHGQTDWQPGLYLPTRMAYQRYGRPFIQNHLYTVNEYFGAYDPTNGASSLYSEFDPDDDLEREDDTGPEQY